MPGKAVRVAVLLVLLAVAAMWAFSRLTARRARTTWERPVTLAVLVVGEPPRGAVDQLRASLEGLVRRLAADRAGYDPDAAGELFMLEVVGPLRTGQRPPGASPGPGWLERALYAFQLWRAARAIDAAAPEFDPGAWDLRVYLVAEPAGDGEARFAEGLGEHGGELGVVHARFDEGGALLAATAVLHEAFHGLGASDKYDAQGHAVLPSGLAEPGLEPRFPQRRAELMVGEVPLGPSQGRLPASVEEVGVGPLTAAEVGWRVPAGGLGAGR